MIPQEWKDYKFIIDGNNYLYEGAKLIIKNDEVLAQ